MAQQTRTAAKPQQRQQTPPPQDPASKGQLAVLPPPRMAFPPPAVMQEYEINEHGWRVLVDATFPAAKTPHAVIMALDYCKRRKLDVFKHPMHIVPIYSNGKWIETIWPGISELRTTAQRTGQYAGMDVPEFGPTIERTFKGRIKDGETAWKDVEVTVQFPEWCRITVYRKLGNDRVPFPGPRVKWLETYARLNNFVEVPNSMWAKRPDGQLEKCAEAAALRRAFPEEIGSDYTIDEFYADGARDVTGEVAATTTHAPATPAEPEPQREHFQKGAGDAPAPTGQAATATAPAKGDGPSTVAQPEAAKKTGRGGKPVTDVIDENEPPPAHDPSDPGPSDPRDDQPAKVDKNALEDGEQKAPEPPKFEEYKRVGDFFAFADPWLQDSSRTEAELVAFGVFYKSYIDERTSPDAKNDKVRNAMLDTMTIWQDAMKAAQKRAQSS